MTVFTVFAFPTPQQYARSVAAWSTVDTAATEKYMYVGQGRESLAHAVRVCDVPSARVTVR